MDATNPIDELNALKRIQETLKLNRNDIGALLELAALQEKAELKRKVLNRILSLDPVNKRAREMLLEMDRADMNVRHSPMEPVIAGARTSSGAAAYSLNDPFENPRVFRYSILLQIFVYLLLAFAIYLCTAALRQSDWDVLIVFSAFLLFLMIPLWFVSAEVKISNSGLQLSRLYGIARWEIAWDETESIKPSFLGQGIKIVTREGNLVEISSQMHGYPAILEILRKMRPDLFGVIRNSQVSKAPSDRHGVVFEGIKVFQKSAFTKYGPLLLLFVASLAFLCTLFTLQLLPAILVIVGMIALWSFALYTPHTLTIQGNRLSTESFRKKQEFTLQQIKDISIVSTYTRRGGLKRKHIHLELLDGTAFALAGFSGGDDVMYGFLKNWWGG